MSELQLDKEVRRRQKPLKDVDAPLRDQIPAKLLTKAKEMNLGRKAQNIWSGGNADRTRWLERQRVYLEDWDEFLESSAEGPFEQSSSLHIPMPFIVTKTYHARMLQAIMGDDFRFPAKARREDSQVRESVVSDTMQYALKEWCNKYEGIEAVLDDFIWNWVSTGVGLLKWRWEAEFQRFVDVVPALVTKEVEVVDEEGIERVQPTLVLGEEEIELTKKVFEGPVAENINPEDLIFLGGGGNPQAADVTIHRFWMTKSELWTNVDRKSEESFSE